MKQNQKSDNQQSVLGHALAQVRFKKTNVSTLPTLMQVLFTGSLKNQINVSRNTPIKVSTFVYFVICTIMARHREG